MNDYVRIKIHDGLTGEELRLWRAQQPGEKRGGPGWTQKGAAAWCGVDERTWRRWERGERGIPMTLINRLRDRRASFDEIVDRIFDTPVEDVVRMGGIIPELAGRS